MDAIDTIDWGAYAHFTFMAAKYPDAVRFIQPLYYISSYFVLVGLFTLVLALFLAQKRIRTALSAALGTVAALGMIELCRLLVPKNRPPDARELVGAHDMLGSYPSAGVFLFMLAMIYFGLALWPWLRTRVGRSIFVSITALLTVSVALSEFILATHFVSDVIGGIVGAAIVGFLVARRAEPRKRPG